MRTEAFVAGFRDQVIVFDANPSDSLHIDARFESDDVAGDKDIIAFGNQDRSFRMGETDAVSYMVGERRSLRGSLHRCIHSGVNVLGGRSGLQDFFAG